MKLRYLIFPAIIMAASSVCAQTKQDECALLAQVAGEIMKGRQNGVPLDTMIAVPDTADETEAIKTWLKEITVIAYRSPRYSTDKSKDRAITEFRNSAMIGCLEFK